ncbi:MAG: DUF1800 domain-containing protein [Aquabacterium sp.]|nr:MAG: DUF1800 domain-containing protein [Aquabacterium sp.]
MEFPMKHALRLLLSTALLAIGPAHAAGTTEAEALHAIDRLSLGAAPGDLKHVMDVGVDRYIDEQLHPERLPLPQALVRRLDGLATQQLNQRELVARFRAATQAAEDDSAAGKAQRRELVQQLVLESGEARLARAQSSPRQLEEVMVDFWFNHFNVYSGKGLVRVLAADYEREAIRPHALGRFRDLLGATARHPAMLFYLDNWLSAAPGFQPRVRRGPAAKAGGLNENYARELMELHTLGVDGGYTQQDVSELARIFTGWTLGPRERGGNGDDRDEDGIFRFDARRHDAGTKRWLGHEVAPAGQAEGEHALDVLAAHPSTARHIAFKLAQAFVADEPPPALVERVARRFRDTGGDVRATLKALFDSPEFRDPKARDAKFKTPWRYVTSTLRATQLPLDRLRPLLGTLNQLGMPLYGCQTPDGYKNTEAAWLNPDAIMRRVAFATALASGKLSGAPPVDADALLGTLGGGISARTRAEVVQADPKLQAALVLGSPDFMRH